MFVNLHVHSEFSLLDGMIKVKDVVNFNKQHNIPYSCITDHGVLYSIPYHYQNATDEGLTPIIGFEAYVAQDHTIQDVNREHFILLAKNNDGYKALSYICSKGATNGFYYKPRIDDNIMLEYGTKDLIATSACLAGRIPKCLLKDDIEGAEKWCKYYAKMFPDSFYLEIQPVAVPDQVKVNKGIIELSKKIGLPLVATTDAHYLDKSLKEAHDMLLCMQSKSSWSDPNRWKFDGNTYYLMDEKEIIQAFKQNGHEVLDQNAVLEAIHNTEDIAKQCKIEFNFDKVYLPKLEPPKDDEVFNKKIAKKKQKDPNFVPEDINYLKHKCYEGLKKVKPEILTDKELLKKYKQRIDKELKVIEKMNFSSYFLIVDEYVHWAKKIMPVGPGRGCFTKDNIVNTNNGIKKIQDVTIDDKVKGIDEIEHNVINTLKYDIKENIILIQTKNKNLKCTKDHLIYSIKKDDYEKGIRIPTWYKAEDLTVDDYVACL